MSQAKHTHHFRLVLQGEITPQTQDPRDDARFEELAKLLFDPAGEIENGELSLTIEPMYVHTIKGEAHGQDDR